MIDFDFMDYYDLMLNRPILDRPTVRQVYRELCDALRRNVEGA